jgi:uncharacterized protein involved in response to NO
MVLWQFGFRPFFLLAGLYGAGIVLWWVATLAVGMSSPVGIPPTWWHAHEMVFGFVCAAVAGFLLTSVPNWTSTPPVAGARLAALAGLWLAGRLALALAGSLPGLFVAIVDLAFLPALVLAIAPPLVAARRAQNLGFPVVLLALAACNLAFHLEVAGRLALGNAGLRVAVGLIAVLVVVIGGRIVPLFTAAALKRAGCNAQVRSFPLANRLAAPVVLLVLACEALAPRSTLSGCAAALAALVLALRMSGWQTRRILGDPLVWSLHLGYAWLPLSLALLSLADLSGALPWSSALHGLTTGVFGTMILAVMTRVSLGHTGRPFVAPPLATTAYLLVTVAALARTFGVLAWPEQSLGLWVIAGCAWASAFALFVAGYWSVLTGPRADGLPG